MNNLYRLSIAIVILFFFSSVSFIQPDSCEALRKENEKLKDDLAIQKALAERAVERAEVAQLEAQKQNEIARLNALEAKKMAEKAMEQQKIAEECAKKKKSN